MKKLVFAVFAAVAMVSVSNVFAANKMVNMTTAEPVDSVAPADSTASTDSTLSMEEAPAADSTSVNPTATAE